VPPPGPRSMGPAERMVRCWGGVAEAGGLLLLPAPPLPAPPLPRALPLLAALLLVLALPCEGLSLAHSLPLPAPLAPHPPPPPSSCGGLNPTHMKQLRLFTTERRVAVKLAVRSCCS